MMNKMIAVLPPIFGLMLMTYSGPAVTLAATSCPPSCECDENSNELLSVHCDGLSMTDIPSNGLPLLTSSLDVSRNKLTSLKTSTFYNIRSLETLNVSRNQIEATEDGTFGFMRLLRSLDLSWNQLTFVQQGTFHGARSLQELHLSNNRLKGMTGAFDGMKDLTNLDLSDNQLTSITELSFRDVTNLRYLYLSNNRIQHIDRRAFRTLHKLLYLVLKGNTLDNHVTRFQFNSIYLSYLDLSECGLKQIPRGIGDSIRYLQLRRNNITQLKVQAFTDCPYINILVLDENQIQSVEEGTFENMFHLRQLWLTDNRLQEIPRPLPVGLRRLLLDSNKIDEVVDVFPSGSNMDTLSLVDNKIARVSVDAFSNVRLLQSLDLSNNRIGQLEGRTFAHNSELKSLQLNMNPLRVMNSESFDGLSGLRSLSLSYIYAPTNSDRPSGLVHQQTPSAGFNLPEDIFHPLTRLTSLDLDSSGDLIFSILSSDTVLGRLSSLQELSLRNSMLTALRPDFPLFFPSLETLRISSNRWHCDTTLMWFRDFILTSGVKVENKEDIKCFTPRPIHSQRLISLKDGEFVPKTTIMTSQPVTIPSDVIVTGQVSEYDNNLQGPQANNAVTNGTVFNQEGWRDYEVEPVRHLAKEDELFDIFDSNVDTYAEYNYDLLLKAAIRSNRLGQSTLTQNSYVTLSAGRKSTPLKEKVLSNAVEGNKNELKLPAQTVTESTQKKGGVRKKQGVQMPPDNNGFVPYLISTETPEYIGAVRHDDDAAGSDADSSSDDPFRYRIVAVTLTIAITIVIACAIVAIIICVWNQKQKRQSANELEQTSMLPQHTVIKYKNKNGVLYFSSTDRSTRGGDRDSGVHSLQGSSQPRTPDSVKTSSSSSMPDVHIVSQSMKFYKPPEYGRDGVQ